MDSTFARVAALLLVSALVGGLAVRLRQPLVIAFIAVGILAGPAGLGWVAVDDPIDLLAQMGIVLLLFIVGLKLDFHILRRMGPKILGIGLVLAARTAVTRLIDESEESLRRYEASVAGRAS